MAKDTSTPKALSKAELLMKQIKKNSDSTFASALVDSRFFNRKLHSLVTDIPMLNVALSAKINEGLYSGITTIAGESKRFKTLFGLYFMRTFLSTYPDGVAIFYDTEFGMNDEYINRYNLPRDRIVHIPIRYVEDLKHEIAKQLDDFSANMQNEIPKVFMLVDSIGMLPSRKEIDDAVSNNEAADLTRARQLKSLFRIITGQLRMLEIPMICINHVYKEIGGGFGPPKDIVGGGQGGYLASDDVWIIGRQQDREKSGDKEIKGYNFIINIDKSRLVKEKSKIPITVHWKDGIHRFSGLTELAVEFGIIQPGKVGKSNGYIWVNSKGNLESKAAVIDTDEVFWNAIFDNTNLQELIFNKFSQTSTTKTDDDGAEEKE